MAMAATSSWLNVEEQRTSLSDPLFPFERCVQIIGGGESSPLPPAHFTHEFSGYP